MQIRHVKVRGFSLVLVLIQFVGSLNTFKVKLKDKPRVKRDVAYIVLAKENSKLLHWRFCLACRESIAV